MPLVLRNVFVILAFVLYGWPSTVRGYRMGKTPMKYSQRLYNHADSTKQSTHKREGERMEPPNFGDDRSSISSSGESHKRMTTMDGIDHRKKNKEGNVQATKEPWPSFGDLSRLHTRAFEVREFQLHIPPVAYSPPTLQKSLTRDDVYRQLMNEQATNGSGEAPEGEKKTTETGDNSGAYVDGPVDVIDMVYNDSSIDFRHRTHGLPMHPGKSVLYTWLLERPADVFILNWSGLVTMGCREYIVIAARVLLNLSSIDVSNSKKILERIAKNDIPLWLHEKCRYAMPYLRELTDWIPLLNRFTRDFDDEKYDQLSNKPPEVDESKGALEFVKNHTINGNPFHLVDYLGTTRYKMGTRENEMHFWRIKKHNEAESIYEREFKALGTFKDELKNMFERERRELRRDYETWKHLIMYRTNCIHLPETQKIHHEAFNNAIVESINHHVEFFKMPVYLISDMETSSEMRHQMKVLGVSGSPLIRTFGSESGTAKELVQNICGSLKIDKRIPVHYFDDRVEHLMTVMDNKGLERVRTYFVDWGRSAYDEKLKALYTDEIKYIKTSEKLVRFMSTFTTSKGREWTHGYRVLFPDEEHIDYMVKWKDKWHTDGNSPGTRSIPVT